MKIATRSRTFESTLGDETTKRTYKTEYELTDLSRLCKSSEFRVDKLNKNFLIQYYKAKGEEIPIHPVYVSTKNQKTI